MNWPLVRLLVGWTVGVGMALASWRVPVSVPGTDEWLALHPLRTSGCPGLDPQLAAWQEELSLLDWSVEIDCGMDADLPNTIGVIRSEVSKKRAQIRIRNGMSRGWQQATIVHELIHLGIRAGRWSVPQGQKEEDFVLAAEKRVYLARRREIQRRMLAQAQRLTGDLTSRVPSAATHARTLGGRFPGTRASSAAFRIARSSSPTSPDVPTRPPGRASSATSAGRRSARTSLPKPGTCLRGTASSRG